MPPSDFVFPEFTGSEDLRVCQQSAIPSERVILLVHGLFSNPKRCWGSLAPLLYSDPTLSAFDIALLSYASGFWSNLIPKAQFLNDRIPKLRLYPDQQMPILTRHLRERIHAELGGLDVFVVAHSLGGIVMKSVARSFFEERERLECPLRGLINIATPSLGSRLARIAPAFGKPHAAVLRQGGSFVVDLSQFFEDHVATRSEDFSEDRMPLLVNEVKGTRDGLVDLGSSGTLGSSQGSLWGLPHSELTRPRSHKDPLYIDIRDRILAMAETPYAFLQGSVLHNLRADRTRVPRSALEDDLRRELSSGGTGVAVVGEGGSGKTWLAEAVVHRCIREGRLFSHVVWLSARGGDLRLSTALDRIADVYEKPDLRMQSLQERRAHVLGVLFPNTQPLLIIDSFERLDDQELLGFLRVLPSSATLLVTMRTAEVPSDLTSVSVPLLQRSDVMTFCRALAKSIGVTRASITGARAAHVLAVTGRTPFGVRQLLGLVQAESLTLTDALVRGMQSKHNGEAGPEPALSASWGSFSDDMRACCVLLAWVGAPTSPDTIAGALGFGRSHAMELLDNLRVFGFAESREVEGQRWFAVHDLACDYVQQYQIDSWRDTNGNSIASVVNDYSCRFLEQHGGKHNYRGFRKVRVERHFLLHVVRLAHAHADYDRVLSLWGGLDPYLWHDGYYLERIELGEMAVLASRVLHDRESLAWALFDSIGETRWYLDRDTDAAIAACRDALDVLDEPNHDLVRGYIHYYLARYARHSSEYFVAEGHLGEASGLAGGDRRLLGYVYNNMGTLALQDKEDPELALQFYDQASDIWEDLEDPCMEGVTLRNRGRALRKSGMHEFAEEELSKALGIFGSSEPHSIDHPMEFAEAKLELARVLADAGRHPEATDLLAEAESQFRKTLAAVFIDEARDIRRTLEN